MEQRWQTDCALGIICLLDNYLLNAIFPIRVAWGTAARTLAGQ
jgi:hypothetical protein